MGPRPQRAASRAPGPTGEADLHRGRLPGQDQPEFLLMIPFTPRNKDNLIGLMLARCDGENLGQLWSF